MQDSGHEVRVYRADKVEEPGSQEQDSVNFRVVCRRLVVDVHDEAGLVVGRHNLGGRFGLLYSLDKLFCLKGVQKLLKTCHSQPFILFRLLNIIE